ncbi:MAG: hypothetical protein AMS14_06835 [Planctomycetes bacterium DG_20]|nr:MAG: hypothetical protein AMS14_06835 [Planctomycetes bacterium DG_20]
MRTHKRRIAFGQTQLAGWLFLAAIMSGCHLAGEGPAYRRVPLSPEIVQAARARSADETRANADALKRLWACLSLEQRQSLIWHLLVDQPVPLSDGEWRSLDSAVDSLGADIAPVLLDALGTADPSVRLRACRLAGYVGFRQQGVNPLGEPFVPLLDALVETALRKGAAEDFRLAALDALDDFHEHPAPWVHRMAPLLGDPSPRIRRAAAWTLAQSGPVAAVYAEQMLSQYDIRGNRDDAMRAAWIMDEMGWLPPGVGPDLVAHIRAVPEHESGRLVAPLNYPIDRLPASAETADALLTLPPAHLQHNEICWWIERHAAGDRRFIEPLLRALEADWKPVPANASPTCFYSGSLAEALVAVGRGDAELQQRLLALLEQPIPVDGRLYVGWALSKLTGNPDHLVDALVWVLERDRQRAASYTDQRITSLLQEVAPSVAGRLAPYHPTLRALVSTPVQGNPTGYLLFTGDVETVLKWARADLDETCQSSVCSSALEDVIGEIGPLAEPLTDRLLLLLRESDDWDKPDVCEAVAAIGPTPVTRSLKPELLALAGRLRPVWREEPALGLWGCCRDIDAAMAILLPMLDDRDWATTRACRALAEMGRDARGALGDLRRLAAGANPAYAEAAREAVGQIEAEVSRQAALDELWQELGADDYAQSLRAMWRLVDRGPDVVPWLRRRLDEDDAPMLPGRRMRLHARARQALSILEPRSAEAGSDD